MLSAFKRNYPIRCSMVGYLPMYEVDTVSNAIIEILHREISVQEILSGQLITADRLHELYKLHKYDHSVRTIGRNVHLIAEYIQIPDHPKLIDMRWPVSVRKCVIELLYRAERIRRQSIILKIRRDLIDRVNDKATTELTLGIEQYLSTGSWPRE
jgi:hypothetical protein